MSKKIIAPSLLAADFANLQRDVEMVNQSEAQWFHLDVMDGVFVTNISFGMPVIRDIAKHRFVLILYQHQESNICSCTEQKTRYCEQPNGVGASLYPSLQDPQPLHLDHPNNIPHILQIHILDRCGGSAPVKCALLSLF